MRLTKKKLTVINILTIAILGVGELLIAKSVLELQDSTLKLQYITFELQNSSRRGDISVLVDKLVHKTNQSNSVNVTMFAYICNEGSRKTVIGRIELWTTIKDDYPIPDRWISYRSFLSEDLSTDLNWNDACLNEDESRPFFVSLLIEPLGFWKEDLMLYNFTINIKHEHSWKTINNYSFSEHYPLQILAIETKIFFNDGISDEQKTCTFPVS